MSADPFEDEEFPAGATKLRPLQAVKRPEPKADARSPLDWIDLADREPPERRWAIKGWLGFGHVTLLVGSGGIGKTLIAQQMASCMALGRSFIGEVVEPLKCLMWACEDDHDELWRRQVAISRWCKVPLQDFAERLLIVPRHGLANALVSTEFGKLTYSPLLAELEEQAKDTAAEVVILDNVGQLYGGGENDRHAVTAFLNALSGALPGRALLLLAHPSRSSGSEFSGSSAWENVARTRLYLGATLPGDKPSEDTEAQENVRYLARRKANYSPRDWRRMTYANGALTPDDVDPMAGVVASIRAKNEAEGVLAAFKACAAATVNVPSASTGSRTAYHVLSAQPAFPDSLKSGSGKARFRRILEELRGMSKIREENIRRNDRHFATFLVLQLPDEQHNAGNAGNA